MRTRTPDAADPLEVEENEDLWQCPGCGQMNSQEHDYIRCSCCHHSHPYFCDMETD